MAARIFDPLGTGLLAVGHRQGFEEPAVISEAVLSKVEAAIPQLEPGDGISGYDIWERTEESISWQVINFALRSLVEQGRIHRESDGAVRLYRRQIEKAHVEVANKRGRPRKDGTA